MRYGVGGINILFKAVYEWWFSFMILRKAVSLFLGHCQYEKNLSPKTVTAYEIDLGQFCEWIKGCEKTDLVKEIDKEILREYMKNLYEKGKPKTVKRKTATLKVFFNFLEFEDHILVSPFRKMNVRIKLDQHLPQVLTLEEVQRLFSYLYREKKWAKYGTTAAYKLLIRDIAILEMLFATGMRVGECCALSRESVDLDEGSVRIFGKGRKERIVPICGEEVIRAQREYRQIWREEAEAAPFWFFSRNGTVISDHSIRFMIEKHSKAAGLDKKVKPHTFRHTVATLLLENGVDIRFIQYLLGHSSINVTELYLKVNEKAAREVMVKAHPRRNLNLS